MCQQPSTRPQWQAENFYKIGKLGKPHGVKGEISFLFDDDIFDRTDADFLALEVDGLLVPFFFEEYRFKGSETALVKFVNIDTQERAKELTPDRQPTTLKANFRGLLSWASPLKMWLPKRHWAPFLVWTTPP